MLRSDNSVLDAPAEHWAVIQKGYSEASSSLHYNQEVNFNHHLMKYTIILPTSQMGKQKQKINNYPAVIQ